MLRVVSVLGRQWVSSRFVEKEQLQTHDRVISAHKVLKRSSAGGAGRISGRTPLGMAPEAYRRSLHMIRGGTAVDVSRYPHPV